ESALLVPIGPLRDDRARAGRDRLGTRQTRRGARARAVTRVPGGRPCSRGRFGRRTLAPRRAVHGRRHHRVKIIDLALRRDLLDQRTRLRDYRDRARLRPASLRAAAVNHRLEGAPSLTASPSPAATPAPTHLPRPVHPTDPE